MEEAEKCITVVCSGNTCRSPMAETLLRHALNAQEEPLKSIKVQSAGTAAFTGDPASPNAVTALKKVGLDISEHRSKAISRWMLDESSLILVMTKAHAQAIKSIFPETQAPIFLFREWFSGSIEVPDPFGGHLDMYVETRDALAEAIPSIIEFLNEDFLK